MDRLVSCGLISEYLKFVPEGIPMVVPKVTADMSSEICYEISKEHGSFRGVSTKVWYARYREWKTQDDSRTAAWTKILEMDPSAIQFRTSVGSTNLLSKRNGEWILTAFDNRGPMYHSRISTQEILRINPGDETVWVK